MLYRYYRDSINNQIIAQIVDFGLDIIIQIDMEIDRLIDPQCVIEKTVLGRMKGKVNRASLYLYKDAVPV